MPICSRRRSRSRGGRLASISRRVGGPTSSTASTRAAITSTRCACRRCSGGRSRPRTIAAAAGRTDRSRSSATRFWQRRFGGSADVIGRTQTIDRVPFTIVGVMPPDFFGTDVGSRSDVILPIGTEPLMRGRDSAARSRNHVVAAGDGAAEGRSDHRVGRAGVARRPAANPRGDDARPTRAPRRGRVTSRRRSACSRPPAAHRRCAARYRQPILAIMTVVALVLLIACANIANLFLARGVSAPP